MRFVHGSRILGAGQGAAAHYLSSMKQALIIGASGGIGAALARALTAGGVSVTGVSRSGSGFDVTDPSTIAAGLAALTGPYDLIIIATGILAPPGGTPEKSLAAINADVMAQMMAVNAIGPAMILSHIPRFLPRDRRAVVASLSARVGSIGDNALGGWHSYRASKAALNQIVRGAAIELKRTRPHSICVALHPGTVDTPFGPGHRAGHAAVPPDAAAAHLLSVIDGLTVEDTGTFRDWQGLTIPW
jgi:NAD(P)-dependent dehydrogenase (short-subunit alcohol dehydrogenase family)